MATPLPYSHKERLSDLTDKTVLQPSQRGRQHEQTSAMKRGTACPVSQAQVFLPLPTLVAGRTGRVQLVLARHR